MNRIFIQTLATDLLDRMTKGQIRFMLSLQYMSALTISKLLTKGDEFHLITDMKGKEFVADFPYTHIQTVLDRFPYQRPPKMSAYKIYSIEVFRGADMVHFDNDVYIFKDVPRFSDTLVQSNEEDFIQLAIRNRVKYYQWIFPRDIWEVEKNYNPGVFGFAKNSKVREEYLKTFWKYSTKNIEIIEKIKDYVTREVHKKEFQDVYLVLEEALLYSLCQKHNADVCEIIPNKYEGIENLWGKKDHLKRYSGTNWRRISDITHHKWKENQYAHLINYKDNLPYVQEVFMKVYHQNKTTIDQFLKKKPHEAL